MSFFQLGAEDRLKGNQLMALHKLLDWSRIEHLLSHIHKRDWTRGGGPQPYPPVQMFKALVLAHWHQLSDRELVESLKVRLDFMVFTGFDLGDVLPDSSTICVTPCTIYENHLKYVFGGGCKRACALLSCYLCTSCALLSQKPYQPIDL